MKSKTELPWRKRQQATPRETWWAKLWSSRAAWAGAASVVVAALAWILTNGVDSLTNLRKLPSEVQSTYHMFQGWYYDDALWTGAWSSREEASVEDLHLADQPLKLTLQAQRGVVHGEAFNKSFCDLSPLLQPMMLEGEIHRGSLIAYTFVVVGGERQFVYSFEARRSDSEPIITLTPLRDPHGLLPSGSRLTKRMEQSTKHGESAAAEGSEHPDLECPESPMEYMERLRKEGKLKGVEELWKKRQSSSQN